MDIYRKELNEIYEAQRLESETLDPVCIAALRERVGAMVELNDGCAVVTDASCDRCWLYAGGFGPLMGLSESPQSCIEVDSSDEDLLYVRMHPEDLVEKRMLEYELFRLADSVTADEKCALKATCSIRIRDISGAYRVIDNSTQVCRLSPGGKIWLILCCYSLSPDTGHTGDIRPRIIDTRSGRVTAFSFESRRRNLLSPREKEILTLIREGMPSKQIADRLGISVHTVSRHRQNILDKLSVGNSVEAVAAASAMRLL